MKKRDVKKLRESLYESMLSPEEKTAADAERKERLNAEYTANFWNYMYTGISNTLSKESSSSGGYLVPDSFEGRIISGLREQNIIRRLATVIPTRNKIKTPTVTEHTTAQWVDENNPYVADDMAFGQLELDAYKLTVKTMVSDEMLEDNGVNLEDFLINEMTEAIADLEEETFLTGDGIGKPKGIIYQADVGVKSQSEGFITIDDVINLVYSVRSPYRENGVLIMSTDAFTKLSQVKCAYGKYIWREDITEGADAKFLGYDVYVSPFLDSVESGNKPVLYGDFSQFLIGDRGVRTLKRLEERYADNGQVGFLMTERTDGVLRIPEAVKVLEIS